MKSQILDQASLAHAVEQLCSRDGDLATVVAKHGLPPMWARTPGFPTLLHIILEQQVSLASAQAAFDRLKAALDPLTPQAFLTLDDATLKVIGFSRQKTGYARTLAQAILGGSLDLDALHTADDASVYAQLTSLRGIGAWSAKIYLLMALLRPDVWPVGDLALATAAHQVKRLSARPSAQELEQMAETWRPWRSVAARLLWHDYLQSRRHAPAGHK